MTQSSFWNFDALFTPQDHPARELQDTFYLENLESKNPATSSQIKNVSSSHKKIGNMIGNYLNHKKWFYELIQHV